MQEILVNPAEETWPTVLKRPAFDSSTLVPVVSEILHDVRVNGDAAVRRYAAKFDGAAPALLKVELAEMQAAAELVPAALKAAIEVAKNNITQFHAAQASGTEKIETSPGVLCWRKSLPIEKVGLYVPGGSAPLFSTLLMLAIPAQLAGCKEIIVCTPPAADGKVNPVVLCVAQRLGLKDVFKIGGVQAIGAMAYGTETVPAVNKIFGPGNQYVTAAKQLVNSQGISIDMPAGPSEVAVYADESSDVEFVAADLLSQAEHGADSQVLLVATSVGIAERVREVLRIQLSALPRQGVAALALQNSRFIVMEDKRKAFELLNVYAPEHLIIASADADELAELVVNAGSVFLGNYSPESAGDYATGTNHTLPTNGYARAYSGVSLDSFVKKVTFQQLTAAGLSHIGPAVEEMAAAEGLDAHKNAVSLRLARIAIGEKS